jgi:iron complex transport system ATP-binding protein
MKNRGKSTIDHWKTKAIRKSQIKRPVSSRAPLVLSAIHFTRGQRLILDNVSWSLAPQQSAAILGPNGCGKSTLIRIISAYLWATSGTVALFGHTLGQYPIKKLRDRIGIVEATTLYPFDDKMTTRDVVCSGIFSTLTLGYVRPTPAQWQAAEAAIDHVALGTHSDQLYLTLSTGERMRCLIARALVRQPELLLFDEPTAGLDLPAREAVLATLARLRRRPKPPATIMVTHHLEELLPDTANILLLNSAGRVQASGPPRAVLTSAHLTAAYQWPIQVLRRNGRYHAHADPKSWQLGR